MKTPSSSTSSTLLQGMTAATIANAQKGVSSSGAAAVVDSLDSSLAAVPVFRVLLISLAAISIPFIVKHFTTKVNDHPWLYRAVWAAAFAVNVFTVSLPGRFDTQLKDGKVDIPWRTLFEPAEWAFAIWGVIYIAELLLAGYASLHGQPVLAFKHSALYWLAGNLYQSLWCFSFRPEFKRILFFPAIFLASGSVSLVLTYRAFHEQFFQILSRSGSFDTSLIPIVLSVIPLALHATWLAGATLLNLNGWASVKQFTNPNQISVAFASAFGAAIVGSALSLWSLNPFFAWTSAWALIALSERSSQAKLKTFPEEVQIGLSNTEYALARVAQLIGLAVSLVAAVIVGKPEYASYFKY